MKNFLTPVCLYRILLSKSLTLDFFHRFSPFHSFFHLLCHTKLRRTNASMSLYNRLCHLMSFSLIRSAFSTRTYIKWYKEREWVESLNVLTIQQIALQLQRPRKLFYRYLSQGKKFLQIAMHQLHPYLKRERQVRENVEEIME